MASSKQLLTGLLALLAIGGIYLGYNAAVGPLTDFDPIEPELLVPLADNDNEPLEIKPSKEPEIAAIRGFGPNCKELNCELKIEYRDPKARRQIVPGRGLGLYIYFDDYEVFKDDPKKIRANPISLVYIAKSETGESGDEISTVRGDEAIIEFDRPVDNITKIQSANPVAGEIRGKLVELKNNRKTTDPEDDLVLFSERLLYSEAKNLLWAPDWVRLSERKITATGYGMEVELYPKDPPGTAPVKRKNQAKEIRLTRGVRFDLKLDDDENFLSSSNPPPKPEQGRKPPVPVSIAARGAFAYNLETNQATFSKSVQVVRRLEGSKLGPDGRPVVEERFDQLECDDLTLQFQDSTDPSKPPLQIRVGEPGHPPAQPRPAASGGENRMRLVATTATGKQVILLSDGEKVQATGTYLFHDAVNKRSVLKGEREMIAIHENAVIHARSLIIEQGEEKGVRNFVADGPDGWLEILDQSKDAAARQPDPKAKPRLKVRWQGKMVMTAKPGTDTQVVSISDDVELEDERIALKCDKLLVWLVPLSPEDRAEPPANASPNENGVNKLASQSKLEPVMIKAEGRVAARSDDWDIFTQDLKVNVIRKRAPATDASRTVDASKAVDSGRRATNGQTADQPLTAVSNAEKASPLPAPKRLELEGAQPESKAAVVAAPRSVDASRRAAPNAKSAAKAAVNPLADAKPRAASPAEPKTPLEIRATRVALVVEREGTASRPVSAWAEGQVLVTQAPKKPTDERLEIRGQTLEFERKSEGDRMVVSGQSDSMASIKTADLSLFGHRQIVLDEVRNEVVIPGQGRLLRDSLNDLQGKKLERPQTIRIDFERGMKFDGKLASFEGAVRAVQNEARISSEIMDVAFDRRVDFKEARERRGETERPKTQIDRVDCDRDVVAVDMEKEGDRVVRQSMLKARALHYDNTYRTSTATGPGEVVIVERSAARRDASGKLVPPEQPYERTQVAFDAQMTANRDHQTAKFYENVRILRAPVAGLDVPLDPNRLPRDGISVDANRQVAIAVNEKKDSRTGAVQKYRDFQARGDVRVQGSDYFGSCDQLNFEEEKDLLVFNSDSGRTARFFRQIREGDPASQTSARTIRFWRKSGKVSVDEISGVQSFDLGGDDRRATPRR